MKAHTRALVQRITHGQAVQQALHMAEANNQGIQSTWEQPVASLIPGSTVNSSFAADVSFSVGLWLAPTQKLDLPLIELLWRLVSAMLHRLVFEIAGNKHWVRYTIRGHKADESTVRNAYLGLYPEGAVAAEETTWWRTGKLCAYYEANAGWHPSRITLPDDLPDSFLWAFVEWLQSLDDAVGFYQCVVESAGTSSQWHRDIELHHDLSFLAALASSQTALSRFSQQNPSSELRGRSDELKKKANPDRPFFGVVLRCGVVGDTEVIPEPPRFLSAVRLDGTALVMLPQTPPPAGILEEFFRTGVSPRTGMLLNSAELTTIAHLLPARDGVASKTDWPVHRGDMPPALAAAVGTRIGSASVTGKTCDVVIPWDIRATGTHIVSSPGCGKTTLLKEMFLQDVKNGIGAAFIDPHGDAIHDLMALIPTDQRYRIIYLNPGDPLMTPLWNPLALPAGSDPHRKADDTLSTLKRLSHHWGDRLETVLRHALIGLLYQAPVSIADLYNLTRHKSAESAQLRERIVANCPDPIVRQFWQHDFHKTYRSEDIASSQHKLLKLISGGAVSKMLTQRESKIDLRTIMDTGQLLLVDLSQLGAEARSYLGSFMLSLIVQTAIGRSSIPRAQRKWFSVYADEAHLFVEGDAFESLIAQARKFRLNGVLAHQYLRQFTASQIDALLLAGTTIVGRVDQGDGAILAKKFQGKVIADEISQLPAFHMVARIGTDVVRFQTPPNNDNEDPAAVAQIIAESHKRYYVRATALNTAERPVAPYHPQGHEKADLSYDEF